MGNLYKVYKFSKYFSITRKLAVFLKIHNGMINKTQTLPLDIHLFSEWKNTEFILSFAGVFPTCTTAAENIWPLSSRFTLLVGTPASHNIQNHKDCEVKRDGKTVPSTSRPHSIYLSCKWLSSHLSKHRTNLNMRWFQRCSTCLCLIQQK